jgi:hypothetical protein
MSDAVNPDVVDNAVRPVPRLRTSGVALTVIGALITLPCVFMNVERFAAGYLIAFLFAWSIALGALFYVALHHVTHAVWSVGVRRVAETLASPMWLVGLLFLPLLVFGLLWNVFGLYPWNAAEAGRDHLVDLKAPYLNSWFAIGRAALYFAVWLLFARLYVGKSLAQDEEEGERVNLAVNLRRISPPFLILFAFTVSFASVDWVLSLDPHWFSTIFGVYVFSGMAVAAMAAIIVMTLWLRRLGRIDAAIARNDHIYNLGGLLFAMTCFWGYIAFSQYLLIWYANMPEESFYIHERVTGAWGAVTVALALVRFVIPFFMLLSRRAKTSPPLLLTASGLILVGQALDLYWLVIPEYSEAGPVFGFYEIGPLALVIGLFLVAVARFLGRHAAQPMGDPFFEDAKAFHL